MTSNHIMIVPEQVTAAVLSALEHPAKPDALEQLLPRLCMRCGAVGTHYLTCASLRLPPGYRLSEDPWPERRAWHRGEHRITRSGPHTSLVSGWDPEHPPGGPDHPDWPRPPQH